MNRAPEQPESKRRIVVKGLVLGALASLVIAAAMPSNAEAGNYFVKECSPGDGPAPDAAYTTNGALAFTPANACDFAQIGVAIGTQGSGFSGPLHAAWIFAAPAGAFLDGATVQRRSQTGSTYAPIVSVCTNGGFCNGYADNTGGIYLPTVFGPAGWNYLSVFMGCGLSTCTADTALVAVRSLEFQVNDVTSPVVTSLGGSLLSDGAKRGTESLSMRASDAGGGLRQVVVNVNGAQIDSRTLGCSISVGVASLLRPCGNANESFSVNTEAAPWVPGNNTLEVCAYDLATSGSSNAGCAAQTVVVDNSCANSQGGAQATSMSAGLQEEDAKSDLSSTVKVRSSEGATVRGQLAGPSGPVGGANVCLYEKIDVAGDIRKLAQTTKSKTDGTFGIQVEPGPSRYLDVVYRFNNQVVEHAQLYLESEVEPTLKMKPNKGLTNGETTGFFGELPGPNAESRGVSLQAKAGKKWRTFKQIKTNESGKFRGRYKFTHTRGRVTYKFRARVKRQGGYPYSPGSSPKRKVKVRG